jgi:pimeloyl-ACP methyl ester carboxylesterase
MITPAMTTKRNREFLVLPCIFLIFFPLRINFTRIALNSIASTCWTEFYIDHGYDVYLFNYAGYGRSFGGSSWNQTTAEFSHGFLGALKRVLFSTFLAFKPSSESLKFDAAVVARYIVDVVGVDELVIHGESIGGMAAAGAAKALTETSSLSNVSTILVCDRTFCNLEAVAQRLVGRWTGNAIRLLTPTWSTDVTRDFLAARCPKIVAQDSADEIIHDYSSLKSGLAFAGELTKGQTSKVGWIMSPLIEYQIANLDNVSVTDSRLLSKSHQMKKSPPLWPADKHVSWSEAHHFAACLTRIGKLATAAKKQMQADADTRHPSGDDEGIEVSLLSDKSPKLMPVIPAKKKNAEAEALIKLWKSLACCDGLCGHHLGHTVKEGFDCTISWLCCTVVFGPQVLAEQAEKRWDKQSRDDSISSDDGRVILPEDFDLRPPGYQLDEDSVANYPLPIPEVLSSLKVLATQMKAAKEGMFCVLLVSLSFSSSFSAFIELIQLLKQN